MMVILIMISKSSFNDVIIRGSATSFPESALENDNKETKNIHSESQFTTDTDSISITGVDNEGKNSKK